MTEEMISVISQFKAGVLPSFISKQREYDTEFINRILNELPQTISMIPHPYRHTLYVILHTFNETYYDQFRNIDEIIRLCSRAIESWDMVLLSCILNSISPEKIVELLTQEIPSRRVSIFNTYVSCYLFAETLNTDLNITKPDIIDLLEYITEECTNAEIKGLVESYDTQIWCPTIIGKGKE